MKRLQRLGAIIGVILLVGMVFLTLFFAVTGSRYFMGSLFAMIVIPIFIYGYMTIIRVMSDSDRQQWKDALDREKQEASDQPDSSGKPKE